MSSEREFLEEFIEIYKNNPCLWMKKDKNYYSLHKKNSAYDILLEKLKTMEPNATKKTVTRKINSLQSSYRKEHKKVVQSSKSGAGTSEKYEPSLWYYNLLYFLHDQEIPRQGISNTENPEEDGNTVSRNVIEYFIRYNAL
jgi:hypothetical protein